MPDLVGSGISYSFQYTKCVEKRFVGEKFLTRKALWH